MEATNYPAMHRTAPLPHRESWTNAHGTVVKRSTHTLTTFPETNVYYPNVTLLIWSDNLACQEDQILMSTDENIPGHGKQPGKPGWNQKCVYKRSIRSEGGSKSYRTYPTPGSA